MKNKPQNNTQTDKSTKKLTAPWEDYYCMRSFKTKPVNTAWLAEFSEKWVQRAEQDKDYKYIHRYPTEMGISRHTISLWKERSSEVKSAYEQVTAICTMRQVEGSMERKLDGNFVKWMLPMFDEDTKKMEEWRSKLKDENSNTSGPQIVVLEKYPETDVPKVKK